MELKFGDFYCTKEYKYLPNEYFTILKIKDYEIEEVKDSLIIRGATIEGDSDSVNSYMHEKGKVKFNIDGHAILNVVISRGYLDDNSKLFLELEVEQTNTLASGSDTSGKPIHN